jgi:putative membrane protein
MTGMTWEHIHPAINAALNGTCAVLLILGRIAIARREHDRHRSLMIGAFATSTVFLISYVIRFATTGSHKYPGDGIDKVIYLVVLFSHMILAVVLVPLVLRALALALRGDYEKHLRVVKWGFPIWLYVSVTGVIVYFMLYHLAPALT